MKRPVIGITTGGRREGYIKSRHYDAFYSTPAPYVDAVRRAEGIPLLLPPGTENDQELLPLLDGVIVTGGTDIDPAEYDGDSSNAHLLPFDRERDRSELSPAARERIGASPAARERIAPAVYLSWNAIAERGGGRQSL